MGGNTISTSDTRVEALTLQSSVIGACIPIVYGTNRVPGNLIWYGGFKAIPHTTSSGGKGGGIKTQNTTYTYQASVLMAIAQGQVRDITTIWRDKEVITGGQLVNPPNSTSENFTLAAGLGAWCTPVTVSHSSDYFAPNAVRLTLAGGFLAEGSDFTRVGATYTFRAGLAGRTVQILYFYGSQTISGNTAMQQIGVTLQKGAMDQTALGWMTSSFPTSAYNYHGLAYVGAQNYDLGTGAKIQNHSFEVEGIGARTVTAGLLDVDPQLFLSDILTNGRYGAHMPSSVIPDLTTWSTYCRASNTLLSPFLDAQVRAADLVEQVASLTNTAPVWSGGTLKMIPYGDQALTGNGATYTPNVTPVYDIGDDQWLANGSEDPIKITRKAPSDQYNHIRVEFKNRANYYNTEVEEAKDDADIATYGLRTMQTISAPWVTTRAVARVVAQMALQRSLNITAQYEFLLPWSYILLEPMDLVTVTDVTLGLNQYAVRITEWNEDDNGIAIVAEDFPIGVASAALYPSQNNSGFLHNYLVSPGSVSAPVIFEAPVTLPSTGLEVYAAVAGASANWGGCNVWVSMDGTNYRRVQTIYGGARYGKLTSVVSSSVGITTTGTLQSGSAADSAALTTLCYIGGASPEYLAYTTATLTGAGAYTLAGLTRGGYSTNGSAAHAINDPFVRIDESIARTGALDLSMIGKAIYLKFTSFNIYGGAEESIASVTQYAYTITGAMVQLPPSAVTSVSAVIEKVGVRLTCAKNPEPDVVAYEWRVGSVWGTATVLDRNAGTSYLWGMQPPGTYTVWVAARDIFNNLSTPVSASVVVNAASVTGISATIAATDLVLTWTGVPASFAIGSYELRYGLVYASATSIATATVTRHVRRIDWSGLQRWWITPIDVQGNAGTPSSIDVTVTAPGAIIPGTPSKPSTETIDNNVLLYWTAPSTGSLPIDRYEVRKGASWAAGATVGSNGNSTFTAIFEQASGTFTYWIAAYDTAGNIGTPTSIVATVSQPPDYILRSNIDSTFTGTYSNTWLEGGVIYGPSDSAATWATHFSGNAWASPDAQNTAGYPLYFEPSATSGYYEEVFDYGAVLPATTVTATVNSTLITGAVTITPLISWKKLVGDAWTDLAPGVSSALLTTFQFIKVRYTLTGTGGLNLAKITGINVKLNVKLRQDSGAVASVAVGGTAVTFGYPFIAADTPIFQPGGSTPLIPVVIYAGGANPTGFTIKLFSTAGVDVGGASGGSWTVRGY
ncbi:MAG: phage tail protein [Leptothrix sp. (in: b-proteobacteria)]